MSMILRCVQCDAKIDSYGRDGGMPLCRRCLDELREERPAKRRAA